MDTRRIGVSIAAVALLATATAWGLSVSVGASDQMIERSELPDVGFSRAVGKPETLVRAGWGSGDGQMGVSRDGQTLGPDSFGVDDRERVYVLDGVNRRVTRFAGGAFDRAFTLPDTGFEDMVVSRGRFAVLSRHENRRVLVFDADEGLVATLAIAPDVPAIMRLLAVGNDLLVECPSISGRDYHVIGTLDGRSASARRQVVPRPGGAPVPTGDTLVASITDANNATVDVLKPGGTAKVKIRAHSARDIAGLVDVLGDRSGNVFVVYGLSSEDLGHPAGTKGRLVVAKYSVAGELIARMETGDVYDPEPFRKIALSESGDVYQLAPDRDGVSVLRWTLTPER